MRLAKKNAGAGRETELVGVAHIVDKHVGKASFFFYYSAENVSGLDALLYDHSCYKYRKLSKLDQFLLSVNCHSSNWKKVRVSMHGSSCVRSLISGAVVNGELEVSWKMNQASLDSDSYYL